MTSLSQSCTKKMTEGVVETVAERHTVWDDAMWEHTRAHATDGANRYDEVMHLQSYATYKASCTVYEYVVRLDDGGHVRVPVEHGDLKRWDTRVGDRVRIDAPGRYHNLTRGPPARRPNVRMEGETHIGNDGRSYVVCVTTRHGPKQACRVARWEVSDE